MRINLINVSGIYIGKNQLNNKVYVGSSKRVKYRVEQEHIKSLNKNKHGNKFLQEDWNVYGQENFVWFLVEIIDIKDRKAKEQFWMNLFHSGNKKYGYNIWRTVRDITPFEKASEIQKTLWACEKHHKMMCDARQKSYKNNPERKIQDSIRSQKFWADPKYRFQQMEIRNLPKFRANLSNRITDLWQDEKYRNSQTQAITEAVQKPEFRDNVSIKIEELWDTPEYRNRMIETRRKKVWDDPVKREKVLAAMAEGRRKRYNRLHGIDS